METFMKNMFNKKVFSSWLLVFLTFLLLFNVINLKNNVMRYYFLHFFDYVNKYEKREGFEVTMFIIHVTLTMNIVQVI